MLLCRYVAVCHPTRVNQLASIQKTYIALGGIMAASVIFNFPRFLAYSVAYKPDGTGTINTSKDFAHTTSYQKGYMMVAYFFVIYVLPFASLTYMTARLVWVLKRKTKKREEMTLKMKKEDGITWVLVTVVLTFMLCQLLEPSVRILRGVLDHKVLYDCNFFFTYWQAISTLGLLVNASSNFIIYCNLGTFGRHFRRQLRKRLGLSVAVGAVGESSVGSSTANRGNTMPTNVNKTSV